MSVSYTHLDVYKRQVGVLYGAATGIGYIDGFSSGGTDSIARVIRQKSTCSMPYMMTG